jgi:hypothetical protein
MSESLPPAGIADAFERLPPPSGNYATHEVMNQATPFAGHRG